MRVLEIACWDETEPRVVLPLGNVLVGNFPVYPPPTTTAGDALNFALSGLPSDTWDAVQIVGGSGLQGSIADDLWLGGRREFIRKVNHLSCVPRLIRSDRVHMQGGSFTCIRNDRTIAWEFPLFHYCISDGSGSYPSSLFISKYVCGILGRFIKALLRLCEAILSDLLLRGNGVRVVLFRLLPGPLHLRELSTHNPQLTSRNDGVNSSAQSCYSSENCGQFRDRTRRSPTAFEGLFVFFFGVLGLGAGWVSGVCHVVYFSKTSRRPGEAHRGLRDSGSIPSLC